VPLLPHVIKTLPVSEDTDAIVYDPACKRVFLGHATSPFATYSPMESIPLR
jgi:hypothetical protein